MGIGGGISHYPADYRVSGERRELTSASGAIKHLKRSDFFRPGLSPTKIRKLSDGGSNPSQAP